MNLYIIIGILCVVLIIVVCIIYHLINKKEKPHNLHSKEYKTEIYNNTPIEYKESIRHLYNKLEQLDKIVDRNNKSLNTQSTQVVNDILKKALDAERKINEYWEFHKRKADFYYYIGLHYTSFTLADKLTEELEKLKKIKKMLIREIL